jgi:hypothetical protein
MSTALATLPASALRTRGSGSGTGLQTLEGTVSAFFALEGFDRRRGVAMYSLRVINRTSSALVCRTWVVSRTGDAILAHPILVEVAPLSVSATHLPVWSRDFASFDRAIAEIAGEGVHCVVEAPAPVVAPAHRTYAWLAAATFGVIVSALGAAGALRAATPRIAAFAVPPEAMAGTTVRAEYDVSGAGRLTYWVLAPDGRAVQTGTLAHSSGAIPIAIPVSGEPGAYTLQLVMDGPLGSVAATRVLNALAARNAGAAQIDSISVTPAVAKPGEPIDVAYSAAGDSGYVRLMSTDGTIWQQRPFSRDGQTQLLIPKLADQRELRVMLHVTKGRTAAQSMAGLVVASATAPAAANPSPQLAGDDDPGAAAAMSADANGTFAVVGQTFKSGGSIHVRILSPRNGMRIALTDTQSREVFGTDVGAEATAATLRAPVVRAPARYTVVATFTDGFGQESVVAPVTVAP